MKTEFNALIENRTWVLIPRPQYKVYGSLQRYKARLVANGKSQRLGIDYGETFSSVVKPATIRTVLSLATSKKWPIHHLDVKKTLLHGHLNEIVFMHQLLGFHDSEYPDHLCHL